MRRKSERVVKTSPKKAEPTSRRSTRRGKKSPEKSVNDEESENSSDQASNSDNEPEEVPQPVATPLKRSRRLSRTIEKSSSAEEVKATTTTPSRPRRRGAAKKDADIPEEENVEPQPSTVDEKEPKEKPIAEVAAEPVETTGVDSSTEPATKQTEPEPESSNNSVQDDSVKPSKPEEPEVETEKAQETEKPKVTEKEKKTEKAKEKEKEKEKETQKATENETKHESEEQTEKPAPDEPVKSDVVVERVETSKSRKRTLKRVEREVHVEEPPSAPESTEKPEKLDNEVDSREKSPKKPPLDEVKSTDTKETENVEKPTSELSNGNVVSTPNIDSDTADTTAKDTTASETDASAKANKKKPIVRKRKWLSNKTATPKVQEITISTDSLKGLISDVKPVPLSDVKLDSSPEPEHEPDDVKVVSSTSVDYNRRSEEHTVESTEDGNALSITTSRKISVVNESEGEQPLSPAKHNPCNILYITNLVRPFTVLQLKSLLQRTGKIAEDGFWIDKIKSKCFVKYETEDEAVETRHALHGIRWPTSNPKCLNVDFGTESLMEKAVASTANEVKPNVQSRDDRLASSNDLHESTREKAAGAERPVREWDLGKKDSNRPREVERADRERERELKATQSGRDNERDRERERDRDRERGERRKRSNTTSPGRKFVKKDNEPPLRLLDDLFRKTKTTPCIYWLPLTPEQIAVRVEERKKAIERREAMRKEREREEAEERQRRREREKRREESREKEKRREDSREKDKRRDGSREKRRDNSRDRRSRQRDDRDKRRRY